MARLCDHGYFWEVAPRSCPKCRTDIDLIQREEIATLKVTISRLLRYAYHEEECAVMTCCGDLQPCDCGYDELLAALEEAK